MKYLPLRELEGVTSALNFNTLDCHVVGGCDLYTTKAAGNDKKLYKNIENSLESQHESLKRLSASLSPPDAELLHVNLSRSSPFGPLSQISSRRTFAYLIATLNASHPDYDFSQILRPTDFRKEKDLKAVMSAVDDALYNLRPRPAGASLVVPVIPSKGSASNGPQTPGGSQTWGPRMWRVIDHEMTLRECEVYCYSPDEDPFDGEENAIWSLHYLFFNKDRKRVCYIYLRGLSITSHSPSRTPAKPKRARPISTGTGSSSGGASKRARYWLGDRAEDSVHHSWEDDEEYDVIEDPLDDEVDADDVSVFSLRAGMASDEEDIDEIEQLYSAKSRVRRVSEHIAEIMEV